MNLIRGITYTFRFSSFSRCIEAGPPAGLESRHGVAIVERRPGGSATLMKHTLDQRQLNSRLEGWQNDNILGIPDAHIYRCFSWGLMTGTIPLACHARLP